MVCDTSCLTVKPVFPNQSSLALFAVNGEGVFYSSLKKSNVIITLEILFILEIGFFSGDSNCKLWKLKKARQKKGKLTNHLE